jgi:hypothetical protein
MKISQLFAFSLLLLTFSHSVFAYLDLGTGSFILQMLIAGFMGAMYTLKLYWYKVKVVVARLFGKKIATLDDESAPGDNEVQDK